MKENVDFIVCQICGKKLKQINCLHLKTHKVTLLEYKKKFSNIQTICEKIKKKLSNSKNGENNPNYGKHLSKETRLKMSMAHTGKEISKETRIKLSKAKSGKNHPMYDKKHSKEAREKISKAMSGENHPLYGEHHSKEAREKISISRKGQCCGEDNPAKRRDVREKISIAVSGKNNPMYGVHKVGKDNPNWQGGITPFNIMIRSLSKYKEWHRLCLKRDNYICQECGSKKSLHVHHIIEFASIMSFWNIRTVEDAKKCDILWDISNGIVLCSSVCHRERHKDNKGIMSGKTGKTGKMWPQTYKSKEIAEKVLRRYHGWGFGK